MLGRTQLADERRRRKWKHTSQYIDESLELQIQRHHRKFCRRFWMLKCQTSEFMTYWHSVGTCDEK